MIDLHCHVLPNVDDGADSLDVSRRMLLNARQHGFRTIVATPHLSGSLTPEYGRRVRDALTQVIPLAQELQMAVLSGYEIRLTPDLASRLRSGEMSTMVNSRTALVDLSGTGLPHFTETALFAIQAAGYQPILAHPERYPELQQDVDLGLQFAERGIAMQVTIGSLSGAFGKQAQRTAEALLQIGAVHLVASDAHSDGHRQKAVPEGLRRLLRLVGQDQFQQALVDTPQALLSGEPLPPPIKALRSGLFGRLSLSRR